MMKSYNRITGAESDFDVLLSFKKFPIHMLENESTDIKKDKTHPLSIGIDSLSGVVQVLDPPTKEELYVDSHSNAVGGVWNGHHRMVADIIRNYHPKNVLEIGGATGILESYYNKDALNTKNWVIVEPEPHPIKETSATFIKGFFPEALPKGMVYDLLVHTHTMEHMDSICNFIKMISDHMPVGGKMIFSVPNFKELTETVATSILNFEHTVYLTEEYIEWLLASYRFKLLDKQNYINHSIIYCVERINNPIANAIDFKSLYRINKAAFEKYILTHKQRIEELNARIAEADYPVLFFGAHIAMQYYIAFGLNVTGIKHVIDNDKYKHTKRVAGTNKKVYSPSKLSEYEKCAVILPQSPYAEEIKKQILTDINPNVIFWE